MLRFWRCWVPPTSKECRHCPSHTTCSISIADSQCLAPQSLPLGWWGRGAAGGVTVTVASQSTATASPGAWAPMGGTHC